jgi:hypothetical protein
MWKSYSSSMTLKYVEDYLEFLYGTMDIEGNATSLSYYSAYNNTKIKLATYDKSPVSSMGSFCAKARTEKLEACLTDRQVELARKIIFKYRRQFLSLGIVLPEHDSDLELRHPIRNIDRTKYLEHDVDNKQIKLKFPYDPKKVTALHEYSNSSAGVCEWGNGSKNWTFDLTEGNVAKILQLFDQEDLKMADTLTDIITDVLSASFNDLPRIGLDENGMQLINCHARVHEYVQTLGWDSSQISRLPYWTSQASALGLEIDNTVLDDLLKRYTDDIVNIIINRKVTMPSNNQAEVPWYNSLLKANEVLQDYPWVLYLSWWTTKTDWSPFKNMIEYKEKDKNSFRVQKQFADMLQGLTDPIVVVDSVIGRDAVRNFVENNSIKVIYISDSRHP